MVRRVATSRGRYSRISVVIVRNAREGGISWLWARRHRQVATFVAAGATWANMARGASFLSDGRPGWERPSSGLEH
jgi:hypothetical protein